MDNPNSITESSSGRKRLSELRNRRKKRSIVDSIYTSRTTVLVNLIIMIVSGLLLIVGLSYIIRFLFMQRVNMEPVQFGIFIGTILLLAGFWLLYFFYKLKSYFLFLRRLHTEQNYGEN